MASPSPTVSKEQVKHLGWLSRLDLTEDELERYTAQIEQIVKYLDKLDSISLKDGRTIAIRKKASDLRDDVPIAFEADPLGTSHKKDGFVKGPRML